MMNTILWLPQFNMSSYEVLIDREVTSPQIRSLESSSISFVPSECEKALGHLQ